MELGLKERVEIAREKQLATWIEAFVEVGSSILLVFMLFVFMVLLCG